MWVTKNGQQMDIEDGTLPYWRSLGWVEWLPDASAAYLPVPLVGTGIDLTGATDSTAGINALLATVAAGTRYQTVAPVAGTYRIDGTITVDISKLGLFTDAGGVTFDASQNKTGVAIQMAATTAGATQTCKFGGFSLVGPNPSGLTVADGVLNGTTTLTSATMGFNSTRDVGREVLAPTATANQTLADVATTNASPTITSATANFNLRSDIGKAVSGSGIPAGAYILDVTNSTTAVLSANATATATGVSMTITARAAILSGTTIVSVTNATTAVLSQAATATLSGVTVALSGYLASVGIDFSQPDGGGAGAVICNPTDLSVTKFGIGHRYGRNAYTIQHYNSHVGYCNTCVYAPGSVGNNAGERIAYVGSTIYNSDTAIVGQNLFTELFFTSCSLDYCRRIADLRDCQLHLATTHVEKDLQDSTIWFKLAGSQGAVRMVSGTLQGLNGPNANTPAYIVENYSPQGPATVFEGVWFNNMKPTSADFSTGTGSTQVVNGWQSYGDPQFTSVGTSSQLLTDGDMEATTVLDRWSITQDTAAITNPLTGTNISIAKSTSTAHAGTRSIAITKVGGTSTNAKAGLFVPIRRESNTRFRFYVNKIDASAGTFNVTVYHVAATFDGAGVATIKKQTIASGTGNYVTTTGVLGWQQFANGFPIYRAPAWADHLFIEISMFGYPAGTVYVDDVTVTNG